MNDRKNSEENFLNLVLRRFKQKIGTEQFEYAKFSPNRRLLALQTNDKGLVIFRVGDHKEENGGFLNGFKPTNLTWFF